MSELSKSARRFQRFLNERGHAFTVIELPDSTRSAAEAAAALDCTQAQIVKSLVFRARASDRPVIVLASGVHQVDEQLIAERIGEAVDKPDAKYVKKRTGFSIGGVAPIGHKETCPVLVDEVLRAHEVLWAAAGTPHAVFRIDQPIDELIPSADMIRLQPA